MDTVTVVFSNGNVVSFVAEEFKAEGLAGDRSVDVKMYEYKDAQGQDSSVFLKPSEVAGVFLTKAAPGETRAVVYEVGGNPSS